MEDVTISLRVDKELHHEMKLHNEINWSAVLRNAISESIERMDVIDRNRAERASGVIDNLRNKNAFASGKRSVEVICEWRNKRR